ncbi:trypsin-like peptidase domain protein [Bacteriovorax sp. BSW11_IV]|uniref:S1 family peptidase n=1 Tax=Bacteriovorax sp. BSW11_IV TaxID=1353529 RepID=UPI00038A559C|nr:serine protease [Bacteriovorax sp. BSW11_IV]EQC48429.1 trypsin-like peptidase domain protein [Bacteriovorax sp. BSW11_IV]
MSKKTKLLASAVLLISLVGCGVKTEEKIILKDNIVTENTWGLPFQSTPLDYTTIEQQLIIGTPVAKIFYREGGSATGFFISEDGLMMTNHHVIGFDRCSAQRCENLKIVRDFRLGGAMEVYDKVQLLAANDELDYALIKVELPKNTKVPFLKLDLYGVRDHGYNERDKLAIVGHPFGSTLRQGSAYVDRVSGDSFNLKSVALSGNSGSPLIDLKTNRVIGLYNSSKWDKASVKKDGSVEHFGYATRLSKIMDNIKYARGPYDYDDTKGLIIKDMGILDEQQDNLPRKISYERISTIDYWLGNFSNDDFASNLLNILINDNLRTRDETSTNNSKALRNTLWGITSFLRTDKKAELELSQEILEKLKIIYHTNEDTDTFDYTLTPMLIELGLQDRSACRKYAKESNVDYSDLYYIIDLHDICGTTIMEDGVETADYLIGLWRYYIEKDLFNENKYKTFASAVNGNIELNFDLTASQKKDLVSIMAAIAHNLQNIRASYALESMIVLLKENKVKEVLGW